MCAQSQSSKKNRNYDFAVLSTLAMVFVVMGHTGVGFATLDWLFPYDSFHMPLFVFISGYFFETTQVNLHNTWSFIFKQIKRLIIPFFLWNFIYGIVSLIFYFSLGVTWCHPDKFWYRLLLRPFTVGNGFFEFNAPSWFILMLFEVKILNWFFRLILQRLRYRECVITIFYFLLAGGGIICSRNLPRVAMLITITRAIYMLFWLQAGTVYKLVLEKHDTLPSVLYFGILLMLQSLIWIICRKNGIMAFVYNSEFTNGPILTLLTAFTGIAFWLRVSKILSSSIGNSKLVTYISTHTFSIMMHQFLGFTLLNLLLWQIDSILGLNHFDKQAFCIDMYYKYFQSSLTNLKFLYVIFGFLVPLSGCWIWEHIFCGNFLKRKTSRVFKH